MSGILTGFAVIALMIVIGYLFARFGLVGDDQAARKALNKISFIAAIPALVFTVIAETPISYLFGVQVAIQAIIALCAAALFLLGIKLTNTKGVKAPDLIVGSFASGYVNSNNMGFPIAVFVLGNPRAVVPVMLLNLLVFAPIMLMLLDITTTGKVSWKLVLMQPFRNPIIPAAFVGALISGLHITIPPYLWEPLRTLGGAAIPMLLMAFGMSLVGAKPLEAGQTSRRAVVISSVLKSVAMPIMAFLLARYVFDLSPEGVFTAVVIGGLPTAQNIYNYAAQFGRGEILARDVVLLTTLFSPVVLVLAALFLH